MIRSEIDENREVVNRKKKFLEDQEAKIEDKAGMIFYFENKIKSPHFKGAGPPPSFKLNN